MNVIQVRKKPVVVSAMLFDGTPKSADAVMAWANDPTKPFYHADQPIGSYWGTRKDDGTQVVQLRIKTLETRDMKAGHGDERMVADAGDYIIKGLKGEFYPCKPDIFIGSYEAVTPSAAANDDACPSCATTDVRHVAVNIPAAPKAPITVLHVCKNPVCRQPAWYADARDPAAALAWAMGLRA